MVEFDFLLALIVAVKPFPSVYIHIDLIHCNVSESLLWLQIDWSCIILSNS